jgi:lauroyl/myristoyl acyltransferase
VAGSPFTASASDSVSRQPTQELVTTGDLNKFGLLIAGTMLALLVPSRHWLTAANMIATATPKSNASSDKIMRHIPRPMIRPIEHDGVDATSVFRANHLIESAQVMRHYLPWKWSPRLDLVGREHLDAALSRGSGAILWVGDFASTNLVAKMALAVHGYQVAHISRPGHPHSRSRLGRAVINRPQVGVEGRYLTGGHLIASDNPGTLRRAYDLLSRNMVISVRAGTEATRVAEVPFLGGTLAIALGPPHLAASSGAPLLTLFCIRHTPDHYEVHIGPPLPVASGRDFLPPTQAFAARLEPFVREHPGQWQGWESVTPGPIDASGEQPLDAGEVQ